MTRLGYAVNVRSKVVKKKREFEIQMTPDEYLLPGDFPNRQLFREKISEALDIARQRVF